MSCKIVDLLTEAISHGASDIFIVAGKPASMKIENKMVNINDELINYTDTKSIIFEIYGLSNGRTMDILESRGDDDFSFSLPGLARFRVNVFKQRGSLAAVIRIVLFALPNPSMIGIPNSILNLVNSQKGLVLVVGSAGSGKSTTLACLIDKINENEMKHIITLEDPIEYIHSHKLSTVSQREIGLDSQNYVSALRAAMRQSPDVILLGEMRDYETIGTAMTAAETGHLVLSTLHTTSCANSINRIIDVFPPNQQRQISVQLSMVLSAIVSQQLIPCKNGGMIPAFELMVTTPAIRNMIREGKVPQIDATITSSSSETLFSMDYYLQKLYNENLIEKDIALLYASNPDMMAKRIR